MFKTMVNKTPKIYHILHIDNLESIVKDGFLFCDRKITANRGNIKTIGMSKIKERRMALPLESHSGLYVGDCVPFYFSPRSIMLYILHKQNNPDITYRGKQDDIIHLEGDLYKTINWADEHGKKWAFTTSNAGAYSFQDYNDLGHLDKINWQAVNAWAWKKCREEKQAEFLIEDHFPISLVSRVGTMTENISNKVKNILAEKFPRINAEIIPGWYYQ